MLRVVLHIFQRGYDVKLVCHYQYQFNSIIDTMVLIERWKSIIYVLVQIVIWWILKNTKKYHKIAYIMRIHSNTEGALKLKKWNYDTWYSIMFKFTSCCYKGKMRIWMYIICVFSVISVICNSAKWARGKIILCKNEW